VRRWLETTHFEELTEKVRIVVSISEKRLPISESDGPRVFIKFAEYLGQ
jgi:hypothetical protein